MKKLEWSLHILIGILLCIYTKFIIDNFIMDGLDWWIQFLIFSIAVMFSFTFSALLHKYFKYRNPFNQNLRQIRLNKRRKKYNIKRRK